MNVAYLGGSSRAPTVTPRTLDELAQIRGAMWTARLNLPYGPRPGQDSNILAMDYYEHYDARDRAFMVAAYKGRHYTHAVTGPVVDPGGYHGKYPASPDLPTQTEWDAYLDVLQEWHTANIEPVYFAKPDGWEQREAEMDRLDEFHRQPRAQTLIRIVCYPGWEPSGWKYGWTNAMWTRWCARGAAVFPNALRLLHTPADLDAPTGGNDSETFPPGEGNAISWQNVAPFIHGWLVQVGGYVWGGSPTPSAEFLREYAKLWPDLQRRFQTGYGGWPTTSAWGGHPIRVYAAEYAAYGDFWWDWPEAMAIQLGDLAMQSGADGFFDGGTYGTT